MERIFAHLSRKTDSNKSVIGLGGIGLFPAIRNITWYAGARTQPILCDRHVFSSAIYLTRLHFSALSDRNGRGRAIPGTLRSMPGKEYKQTI